MAIAKGIGEQNRQFLDRLHREMSAPFSVSEAADILSLERVRARRLLAYFASRGWLSRIRRGVYTTVPLGASSPSKWRADPWIVGQKMFAPCYVGGWSACEHWDFTEQIFRKIFFMTAAPVRKREETIQGTVFRLKFLRKEMHFGTRPVWRGQAKVFVSDPTRTVVDILDDPSIGGGIRHCADVLREYCESENRSDEELLDYIERRGNRSVFKRLGYLLERLNIQAPSLLARCLDSKSKGLSWLDPSAPAGGRVLKRWNLRVNIRATFNRELT